jgi:hypothetical protein
MLKKDIYRLSIFFSTVFFICSLLGCKKETAIVQPPLGRYTFSTFTVDTFRFKVFVNDFLATDSLLSPVSSFSSVIEITDPVLRIRMADAKTNTTYVDTTLEPIIGAANFAIVQFTSGEFPSLPPPPKEPPPAAGNAKVRFQYLRPTNPIVPFFDSIKCLIRRNISGAVPIDTVVLNRLGLTPFYEAPAGVRYSIVILDPKTGQIIHNGSSASFNTSSFSNFVTAGFYGFSQGGTPGTFNYLIRRIY